MSYVKFVLHGKDDTYVRNFSRRITFENPHKNPLKIEKRQIHINPLNRGSNKKYKNIYVSNSKIIKRKREIKKIKFNYNFLKLGNSLNHLI